MTKRLAPVLLLALSLVTGCAATPDEPSPETVAAPVSTGVAPKEIFYGLIEQTSLAWMSSSTTYCGWNGSIDCGRSCGDGRSSYSSSGAGCACSCTNLVPIEETAK